MNSTTGRNRPSSASPPPSPANAFSEIGVPSTRPGNFFARPLVAPFVPPLSLCTSSPRTTMRSSADIRRSMTRDTASMNLPRFSSPRKSGCSTARAPAISDRSPRMPTSTNAGSGHSDGLMRRTPFPGGDGGREPPVRGPWGPASGSCSVRAAAAAFIASTAWARTAATPASSISPSFVISAATRSSGSRARHAASSSLVR